MGVTTLLAALAACTSSATAPATTAASATTAAPATAGAPAGAPATATAPATTATGTPVVAGPTTAARAEHCPFVGADFVARTMGMRLGRLTVLQSGGKVVGCRFYALQGGPLHRSERLPGPHQPAVEITTQRFSTTLAARNAFVIAARRGTAPTQVRIGDAVAVCFQNDFYPADDGKDWACAVNRGPVEIIVRSVDTTGTFNTVSLLKQVLGAL